VLQPAQLWLNLEETNSYSSEILFGALFLVVILFLPRGVLPTGAEYLSKAQAWIRRRRAAPGETAREPAAGADDAITPTSAPGGAA
jgi:hypothetical protein